MSVLSKVRGTDYEPRTGWFVGFDQQWSSLFGRCNWYDFTLIHLGGEFSPYTGRWELEMALLGVRVCVTYVYDSAFNEAMQRRVDEWLKNPNAATPLDDVLRGEGEKKP